MSRDVMFLLAHDRLEYIKTTIESLLDNTNPTARLIVFYNQSGNPAIEDYLWTNRKWFYQLVFNNINHTDRGGFNAMLSLAKLTSAFNGIDTPEYVAKLEDDLEFRENWLDDLKDVIGFVRSKGIEYRFASGYNPVYRDKDGVLINPPVGSLLHPTLGEIVLREHCGGPCVVTGWDHFEKFREINTASYGDSDREICAQLTRAYPSGKVVCLPNAVNHIGLARGLNFGVKTKVMPAKTAGDPRRRARSNLQSS